MRLYRNNLYIQAVDRSPAISNARHSCDTHDTEYDHIGFWYMILVKLNTNYTNVRDTCGRCGYIYYTCNTSNVFTTNDVFVTTHASYTCDTSYGSDTWCSVTQIVTFDFSPLRDQSLLITHLVASQLKQMGDDLVEYNLFYLQKLSIMIIMTPSGWSGLG